MKKAENPEIHGKLVSEKTGCAHYHSDVDIIAIKFKCCDKYYACYFCHEELENHQPEVWKKDEFDMHAICCGNCGSELTINEYFSSGYTCPACHAAFNPKCKNHNHLYFAAH